MLLGLLTFLDIFGYIFYFLLLFYFKYLILPCGPKVCIEFITILLLFHAVGFLFSKLVES